MLRSSCDGLCPRPATTLPTLLAFTITTLFLFTCSMRAQIPTSQHVVLVIEENTSLSTARADMPWLTGESNTYAYANNYKSNTSGSLMDYLWLASGSCHSAKNCTLPAGTHDFQCTGDSCASAITDDSIFRQMINLGISWKVYAQSYDAAAGCSAGAGCGVPTTPDNGHSTSYYRRHNGATWYSDILNNQSEWSHITDFSHFQTDLTNNALPRFTIIAPDGLHDAHDGTPLAADQFLQAQLTPLLNKSWFQPGGDGLLIVTFDNGNGDVAGLVFTTMIGPNVKNGFVSSVAYQHQNLLRTMLDVLGIADHPGASATASDMSDFFKNTPGNSGVVISNPTNTPQITSPVPLNATATSNGLPITAMKVYLDGNPTEIDTFNGNGTSTLTGHSAYAMGAGTHTFNVNAWDTGGTIYQSQITFTVASTGMVIGSPGQASQDTGGVPFNATVTSNGQAITALKIYLDYDSTPIESFNGNGTGTLTVSDTYVIADGPHTFIVNAWDAGGKIYQSAKHFTVSDTGVVYAAPGSGSQIKNGVPFSATATSNGAAITAMKVYLDYNPTEIASFTGNGTGSLTESSVFTMGTGNHTLITNAWDSSGQIYQDAQTFTVSSTGVNILTPAPGASVSSPVSFSVAATSNGAVITTMKVYLDYNPTEIATYNGNATSSLSEQDSFTISAGTHTLIVNAWDSGGQIYQSAVSFTVQ